QNTEQGYRHEPSGTFFPERTGNFSMIGPKQYDAEGKDVGVGYRTLSEIELTQYIYPASENGKVLSLEDHFNDYIQVILSQYKGAGLKTKKQVRAQGIKGKYAEFRYSEVFHGQVEPLASLFYLFQDKGWFIKLRITYKSGYFIVHEKEIREYLDNIPWPSQDLK
ncbi:MAG: hypothetical protein NTU44_11535, partial [Bacteroidetes bacterium]|nr:hypothetical protein [Bacteroidota bacterium]